MLWLSYGNRKMDTRVAHMKRRRPLPGTSPRPTTQTGGSAANGLDGMIGTLKDTVRLCILLFRLACYGGSYQWHEI